jgi:hypothetical protein
LRTLAGHKKTAARVAISPDSRTLAVGVEYTVVAIEDETLLVELPVGVKGCTSLPSRLTANGWPWPRRTGSSASGIWRRDRCGG